MRDFDGKFGSDRLREVPRELAVVLSYSKIWLSNHLLASDVRIWWATVNHTKSWSNESVALESGMGMASKYFDQYDTHKTWHDMGVIVRGAPVDDVNDHFVEVFNEARVNNTGLPSSRGAKIVRLRYDDYHNVPTNNYLSIVDRNVFALKPPPPVSSFSGN